MPIRRWWDEVWSAMACRARRSSRYRHRARGSTSWRGPFRCCARSPRRSAGPGQPSHVDKAPGFAGGGHRAPASRPARMSHGRIRARDRSSASWRSYWLPTGGLLGGTLESTNFRNRFDCSVVAVRKHGDVISGRIGELRLELGDALLLTVRRRLWPAYAWETTSS